MLINLGRGLSPSSSSNITLIYDYLIIPLDGQSNMEGYGTPYNAVLDATDANILQLSRTGTDVSVETLILATDQLDHYAQPANAIGMGMTYAKQVLADNPNSIIILVPCAKGSSGFTNGWEEGGGLTEEMIARVNKAGELAGALGTVAIHSFLRHQGEANAGMTIELYGNHLYNHCSRVRDEVTLANNTTPWIHGDLSQEGGVIAPSPTSMRNVFHDIATNQPYAGFASSDNVSVEPTFLSHFDATGQRELGSRYYTAYKTALSGSLGMSAPDAVDDLAATVISGTEIQLDWTAPAANSSPIVNYIVKYKLDADSEYTEFYDGIGTATQVNVTGLTPDELYDFIVIPVNAAGVGVASNVESETPTSAITDPADMANNIFAFHKPTLATVDDSTDTGFAESWDNETVGLGDAVQTTTTKKPAGDGSDPYLTYDNSNDVLQFDSLDLGTGSFSISGYVYPTAFDGNGTVFVANKNPNDQIWINIIQNDPGVDGRFVVTIKDASQNSQNISSTSGGLELNTWYHFALTVDRTADEMKLFVDKVQEGGTKDISHITDTISFTAKTYIGSLNGSFSFGGRIGNVEGFDSVLDTDDISNLYDYATQ